MKRAEHQNMSHAPHTVYLALGSNVGDREGSIRKALSLLGDKVKIDKVAKVHETEPWGHADQPLFLNAAARGATVLSPHQLLDFAKEIEAKLGRQKRFRNGPREIDIDIIFYDGLVLESGDLQIPHPRMHERDFVLKPLLEIDPEFVHPALKMSLRELQEAHATLYSA